MDRSELEEALLAAARAIMLVSLHAADEIGAVSVTQLRALTVLADVGEANLARLANGVGVTVSTASRLVDRLTAASLVDRRRAAHTAREVTIRLTPQGRAVLDRYDDARMSVLRSSVDGLREDERSVAVTTLRAIGAVALPGALGPTGGSREQ